MEVSTDRWGLNRHKMFKLIRESLPENITKSKNFVNFKNGIVYVWNINENNLFTLNVKTLQNSAERDNIYQVLMPTDPPMFDVNCIKVNESSTLCAIIGFQGVNILEIPKRWGRSGLFQGGKDSIFCKSSSLDARFLSCNADIVRQVRWHPASQFDDQLIILSSFNDLRVYKTSPVESMTLLAVWSLGHAPISVPYLGTLGDVAVDFDFAPPIVKNVSEEKVEWLNVRWPLLVLFGNGDVYYVSGSSIFETRQVVPKVMGPLCMYPAADDNYGTDASSLLVLPSAPPIVIIATNSGTVHHCLLMSATEDRDDKDTSFNEKSSLVNQALYVFESIEFELGLALDDDDQQLFSCPIYLHRDPILSSRYFCSHDTGINAINIPFTADLELFAAAKDSELDLCLPSFDHHSSSEYLVCTHVSNSTVHQPVLGLTVVDAPLTLIALLGNGEVISLSLTSLHVVNDIHSNLENKADSIKKSQKQAFDAHIKNLLTSSSSRTQPLLKLNSSSKPYPQECLELILRATKLFREENFPRYETVKDEIKRRVRILKSMKVKQIKELKELEAKKTELQAMAEKLADKYEESNEKQEMLTKRAEKVLMLISCIQLTSGSAEKKMANDLQNIKEKIEKFKISMDQIRSKQSYQLKNLEQDSDTSKAKKEIHLSSVKVKAIRSNITKMTSEIASLTSKVNLLKTEVSSISKT